jgi:hypothetical protein
LAAAGSWYAGGKSGLAPATRENLETSETVLFPAAQPCPDRVGRPCAEQAFASDDRGDASVRYLEDGRGSLAEVRFGRVVPEVEQILALLSGKRNVTDAHGDELLA